MEQNFESYVSSVIRPLHRTTPDERQKALQARLAEIDEGDGVLVLVDGHRWVNGLRSLSSNSVDLNTIPFAIIERVEVLLDGASAVYGSDAITGIVNIITRKKVEGINLSSQVGQYSDGDGRQQEQRRQRRGDGEARQAPGQAQFHPCVLVATSLSPALTPLRISTVSGSFVGAV